MYLVTEVAATFSEFEHKEAAYRLRTYRHKAYYSLDRDDGIEHAALFVFLSPDELYCTVVRFRWITSIEVTKRNLEEMILAGRGRWKIENEGFNNQKNGICGIEHLNSHDSRAMKNHYLLTQIADIIMRLYLAWNPAVRETGQSIKNSSSRLLESFRRQTVTDEDVLYIQRYTTVYLE